MAADLIGEIAPASAITKISDAARAIVALDEEYQKLELEIQTARRTIRLCETRKEAIETAIRSFSRSM